MPLESLEGQPNIHDLATEQEEAPKTELQKQYEALKETNFYDAESELWNYEINEDGSLERKYQFSITQFLSVATVAQFDPKAAKGRMDTVVGPALWNDATHEWYWGKNINEKGPEGTAQIHDKAAYLVSEYYMGNSNLKAMFEDFKTKNFSEKHQAWGDEEYLDRNKPTLYDQITALLAESLVDPAAAKVAYEALKSDQYDIDNKTWLDYQQDSSSFNPEWRKVKADYTNLDLIDLLVRHNLGDAEAKNDYFELKNSSTYNPDKQLWRIGKGDDGSGIPSYHIDDQFLGIICEKTFVGDMSDFQKSTPELPQQRSY